MSVRHDINKLLMTLESPVRRAWRLSLLRKGSDITEASKGRSCVVLAPHPDDETLACGATIARKRASNTPVHILIACNGGLSHKSAIISSNELVGIRARETRAATQALGVPEDDVVFLGIPDLEVPQNIDVLTDRLLGMVEEFRVDEVFAPSPLDGQPDHRNLGLAVRTLRRTGRLRCEVLEYPVWSWARGPWFSMGGTPRQRAWRLVADPISSLRLELAPQIVSSDGYVNTKKQAIAMYRSQMTNFTGERDWWSFDESFVNCFLGPYEIFFGQPG
jgi:LmbE family N-acetylglucosaminyl deacetylase